jgi:hypothetical protein
VTAPQEPTSHPPTVPTDPDGKEIPRVPWSQLGPSFMRQWGYPTRAGKRRRQPEHVEILGQNGSGKSFWVRLMLQQRAALRGSHIAVVATKPDDDTLTGFGWPIIDHWPPDYGKNQVIFWVKSKGISKAGRAEQRAKILEFLEKNWKPRANIIIYFDEVAYVCRDLNLNLEVEKYFREGRALGITVVATTQRPQGVTRYMHSESSWTVCFAPKDDEDCERMAQVLGGKRTYMPILWQLNRQNFEFLIVHNLTGEMAISWIDKKAMRHTRKRRKVAPKPGE